MKQENFCTRKKLVVFFLSIFILVFIAFGCSDPSDSTGPYSLDDEELLPFAAMYEVDREQFCLTEIDKDSRIEIERDYHRSRGYDVGLRMYDDGVSRAVAFVLEDDQYVWIGEQETHYSGRTVMTIDGEVPEHITVTYHEKEYGAPSVMGQIISYSGGYENIPQWPTCEQASAIIREWDARRTASNEK